MVILIKIVLNNSLEDKTVNCCCLNYDDYTYIWFFNVLYNCTLYEGFYEKNGFVKIVQSAKI